MAEIRNNQKKEFFNYISIATLLMTSVAIAGLYWDILLLIEVEFPGLKTTILCSEYGVVVSTLVSFKLKYEEVTKIIDVESEKIEFKYTLLITLFLSSFYYFLVIDLESKWEYFSIVSNKFFFFGLGICYKAAYDFIPVLFKLLLKKIERILDSKQKNE